MNEVSGTHDVVVIGGGPAGLTAAIALAQTGANTALIARRAPYSDNRTTALLGGSVDLLQALDVWRRCADKAAPLQAMRLVDDTGRLIRAPEVRFSSDEIGLDAFGYNIENRALIAALEQRAAELSDLTRFDDEADTVTPCDAIVAIGTAHGKSLSAHLVASADGRQSLCREAAGIAVKRRDLNQCALTFNVSHLRPHRNISTEFHTPQGPCVFVPLPGNRCSVVWVAAPKEAERLIALSDDELSVAAERQSHSILGRVKVEPGRHLFPLAIEQPRQFAKARVALVGEAAHVVPPIGAQGLNMGLRDAADLADIVGRAMASGEDPGSPQVLTRYDSALRAVMANGKAFAIPTYSATEVFYVRKDILDAKGLKPPETWEDVYKVAKAVTDKGKLWGYGQSLGAPSYDAEATLAQDYGIFKPQNPDVWRREEFTVEQFEETQTGEKEPTWTAFGTA